MVIIITFQLLPSPVYNECYVRQDGSDYKGKQYLTVSNSTCLDWDHELPVSLGWTATRYPLLANGHAFCRNPGGTRERPWCFKRDARTQDDWMFCNVPWEKQTTCFNGIVINVTVL